MNNSTYFQLLLIVSSIALFIFIVYHLAKFRSISNSCNIYRILIGVFSVLVLVSLLIFQVGLVGAVVGGGVTAGYVIIVIHFLEAALGLGLLINAARGINLKCNSTYENQAFASSKYTSLEKLVPLIFIVFSVCFIILIFSLWSFDLG